MPKIALAQIEILAGQPARNAEKILHYVELAKNQQAEVVIFPATAISGSIVGDTLKQKSFLRDCEFYRDEIVAVSSNITIIFGSIEENLSKIFVAHNGNLIQLENSVCNLKISKKNYRVACNLNEDFTSAEVDLQINIASTPFRIGNEKIREEKFSAQVKKSGCPIIYVNATGIQNRGKVIYTYEGLSTIYNAKGEIVHGLEPYEENLSVIDFDEINNLPALEVADIEEVEEIYSSLYYGVEKFLQQININKVVIGISGGIDSAVAAALYTKILGAENIYLVNMPSVFNSATTRGLSEQLAQNLGCNYAVVPIQESVDFTVNQLNNTQFNRRGKNSSINISNFVKENIQARDRSGRILAAVAAAVGGVFTCNANKAETTVGYATLYGDEAGFLCALADLWKFQVYELANYLNEVIYEGEVIPQGIINIVPSAELSSAQNVDEGKGDPLKYLYHDYLFRAFVEDLKTPEDILNWYLEGSLEQNIGCKRGLVNRYFPTEKEFVADLERWWKLFTGMAVAKRIQSPPIIAVSRRAYGEYNESQNVPYFTQKYLAMRDEI